MILICCLLSDHWLDILFGCCLLSLAFFFHPCVLLEMMTGWKSDESSTDEFNGNWFLSRRVARLPGSRKNRETSAARCACCEMKRLRKRKTSSKLIKKS